MSVSSKIDTDKKEGWIDLIGQPCRTSDNQELGHLEAISNDFIVIRKSIRGNSHSLLLHSL
jgi:hypothetical protein